MELCKKYLNFTTVQLRTDCGESTGFVIDLKRHENEMIPVIITNGHCLKNVDTLQLTLTIRKPDGTYATQNNTLTGISDAVFFDEDSDLCALPLSLLFYNTVKLDRKIVIFPIDYNDILLNEADYLLFDGITNVIIVGYPSGYRDVTNNLPFATRGITATPLFADYEGRKEFVVESNIMEGNSGSPVFVLNSDGKYKLAGVICSIKKIFADSEFNNGTVNMKGFCQIPSGYGFAIKSSQIKKLVDKIYSSIKLVHFIL